MSEKFESVASSQEDEEKSRIESNKNKRFRQLVEDLIGESGLFESMPPRATLGREYTAAEKEEMRKERIRILEAIEKNELSFFVSKYANDRELDAIHCLTAIYDELEKENPDDVFIEQTIERLKEYL